MIFRSIHIKEGLAERLVDFTSGVNLIHSEKNSRGKTTLLRFMLYSLGYNIPNTRKIKFDRCEVTANLSCEKCGDITLFRCSNSYIVATLNGEQVTYVLPDQMDELHRILYGTDNAEILDNLLGAFYVDQEKGWTLLNRGTVIGSIHFNIEELIRGISGRDCSALIRKEAQLAKELSKYKQMFSVAQYRETIIAESGSLAADSYYEEADVATNQLLIQQKRLKAELARIDHALKDNRRFRNFVAEMKLMVRTPDGDTIPVTVDNVVGLSDTIDFLVAKRKIIASELASVTSKIAALEKEKDSEEQQMAFFQSENMVEIFDKKIAAVPINAVAIEKEIKRIEKALQSIRKEITDKTKANNSVVSSLYRNIVKYATELGVGNSETIAASYIFTSNLKELSGAVLHKTVFAFRLAYIIEIEKALGIKLPIILDSPSGKEVDQANIQLMVDILKRDFADNQIIIASIFRYDFDEVKTIEIVNRLIE